MKENEGYQEDLGKEEKKEARTPDNTAPSEKPHNDQPQVTEEGKEGTPTKEELPEKADKESQKQKSHSFFANFGLGQDKEYFIENLSILLASGMNIITALDALKDGLRSKRMRVITEQVKSEISNGSPIWKALEKISIFSDHTISLIRIGEKSGRLAANLKVIVVQDQKERIFRSKLFSAMMYPVVILCMTLIVGTGIAWFILPRLTTVFTQMDLELPVTTRILIAIGSFLEKNGIVVIPAVIFIMILLIYFVFLNKKTNFIGQRIILATPGINKLVKQIELARFGFVLGNLLSAGMPLVDALDSLQEISSYRIYLKFYAFLRSNVEEGNSFQKSFTAYNNTKQFIPYPIQQMIVASEQSASLKETFLSIGEIYEEKIDISTKNLSVIVEPILLFVVWLMVVFVALSVIMPIYSLIGGFN